MNRRKTLCWTRIEISRKYINEATRRRRIKQQSGNNASGLWHSHHHHHYHHAISVSSRIGETMLIRESTVLRGSRLKTYHHYYFVLSAGTMCPFSDCITGVQSQSKVVVVTEVSLCPPLLLFSSDDPLGVLDREI